MEYQKISGKFSCRFCKEQFDLPKTLYTHLQQVHSTASSVKDNRTCPLCGVQCAKYEGYRDHLLYIHGQRTEGQKLNFKTLNEFLLWKTELEAKHSCKYILQSAPKVLSSNDKKYFYQCDRSESREGKEKKISTVVKKTCPSMISVVESSGNPQFKVEYWDTHSEHKIHSIPVQKDELAAAISSVEMVQAISDDGQSFRKTENLNISGEANGALSQSFHDVNSSAIQEKTSKVKNTFSSKTDVMNKKRTPSSCLYSLASVACMKGINKNSKNKTNLKTTNKLKDNLSTPVTESSVLPENAIVQDSKKTESKLLNKNSSLVSDLSKISDVTSLKPLKPKEVTEPSVSTVSQLPSAVSSPVTNNSAFAGQVLLLNPVPVGQNALNTTQNVFPSGQNILFSFSPVAQNILPVNQPVLSADSKVSPGEKSTTSEKKTSVSPRKKVTVEKTKSELPHAVSHAQTTYGKNNVVTSVANTLLPVNANVSNTPVSTVLLSTLPVGSTFMNINNNLIPIRNSTGTFLSPSINPGIVLAPAIPNSLVTSKIPSSPINATPKPRMSTPGVTSCIPVFPNLPATSPVMSLVSGNTSKESTQNSSVSLNMLTNSLSAVPTSAISIGNILPANNSMTKSKTSISNQTAVETISLNNVPISSAPSITVPSMHVDSQKPGTLLFESSGNVYMLEPVDNDLNEVPVSKTATNSHLDKTETKNIDSSSSRNLCDDSEKSFSSKRHLIEDGDSSAAQKVKYYQLEMKYLTCQEECKRLKLELAKAEKQNEVLSKEFGKNFRKEGERISNVKKAHKSSQLIKELEDNFGDDDSDIYVMTRTSVLRNLYLEVQELSEEKNCLLKELEDYRNHDKFYKMLKKKLDEEDF